MSTLYLCGGGNSEAVRLAITVNRATPRWDRMALLDDNPAMHGRTHLGVPVIGPLSELANAAPDSEAANLVSKTTSGRAAVNRKIRDYGIPIVSLIHPGVDLFGTELGPSVTAYPNAVIGAESRIERDSVIFMGAIAGNRSHVGECCVLAPNAVLNARVQLGTGVYVGTGATVLPDITVGDGATIGTNTAVVENVPPGATVMGVPGQVMIRASHTPAPPDAPPTVALNNGIDGVIREVWAEVLGRNGFGDHDNFFDVGGTSLKAFEVLSRLNRSLPSPVGIPDIFGYPTVASLASHLSLAEPEMSAPFARASLRRQLARSRFLRRA